MKNENLITKLVDASELTKVRVETYQKDQIIQEIIILLDQKGRGDIIEDIISNKILNRHQVNKYLNETTCI